ncbi:uncharacterized protein N7479_001270 [Penicillium vulpinum]|uniref:Uncharacterized protein n=1 Tax=Penicillium vulpinum TaxID=29845 RepID=A0A1V6RZ94_9EURO|nr:uncharacterized protein N7479_001270 [Penicillium vulpinum]KAJ5971352.1 hypothetical protein N7479_001270 [Penicillium vulpinum]OQE07107.1 hypothetical protein PENVUL_c015G10148 [Penicillium vulpinum]
MEQAGQDFYGGGFNDWPILLRPLCGTLTLVMGTAKFIFYILLPLIATGAILFGIVALIIYVIGALISLIPGKGKDGTRKKSDDDKKARGGVERRLEAGEFKS